MITRVMLGRTDHLLYSTRDTNPNRLSRCSGYYEGQSSAPIDYLICMSTFDCANFEIWRQFK